MPVKLSAVWKPCCCIEKCFSQQLMLEWFDFLFPDMRRAPCFEMFTGSQCIGSMSNNVTKQRCCCSSGAGWGFPCELCPEEGTRMYHPVLATTQGFHGGVGRHAKEIFSCQLHVSWIIYMWGKTVVTKGRIREKDIYEGLPYLQTFPHNPHVTFDLVVYMVSSTISLYLMDNVVRV